jgi:uncharacterized cupredoxin-like copper-binding protein
MPCSNLLRASALASVFFVVGLSASAMAETVQVSMADHGAEVEMPKEMGMGMAEADPSKAPLTMVATPATMKAGKVTFEVTNTSKDMVHEMVVVPLDKPAQSLPYDEEKEQVDEDAAGSLGEVEELDPGKSGSLSLDLQPGRYILFCNVPGHYAAGMWTEFTVTE